MVLPMRVLKISGFNGTIEFTLTNMFGFNDIDGGRALCGTVDIEAACYRVHCENYYFSSETLNRLLTQMRVCYDTLVGQADYLPLYDRELTFSIKMTSLGHAIIVGQFQERADFENKLLFKIETDQTQLKDALVDLERGLCWIKNHGTDFAI